MSQPQMREGQTYDGESLAARYASFVKLPHTLFALPFAGVGAILASYSYPAGITVATVGWIVLAFTAARFAAMGFNRIVDSHWDALNPRTSARELPAGRLTRSQAIGAVVATSATFVFAAWMLNPLCGMLSPAALGWVFFYSYTKRFTTSAHFVLGIGLGIAPAGAYLAVAGAWPQPWFMLPVLSAAVMFWVAGFDIIYSLQDLDFDRAHGLRSIPARVGARRALLFARLSHAAAFVLFAIIGVTGWFRVGPLFLGGVLVMAGLLVYEHRVIGDGELSRLDLGRVDRAFFHANIAVSMSFLAFTLLDRMAA